MDTISNMRWLCCITFIICLSTKCVQISHDSPAKAHRPQRKKPVLECCYSSWNPPAALTASTSRLYSLNSSPTSDTLISSSLQFKNRLLGGAIRIEIGDCGREDTGDSTCLELIAPCGGTINDERREPVGDI